MAVFRWGNPLPAFRDLEREIDRWAKSMDLAIEGLRLGRPFPALNLYEIPGAYLLTAELPGCEGADVDVSVANGAMVLRGQRSIDAGVREDRFRRSERPSGRWERTVSLPDRIDEDGIRAELTNGLLKLFLPKLPESAPRQIQISASGAVASPDAIAATHMTPAGETP